MSNKQARALWNELDQLRRQPHWERDGLYAIAAALREAEARGLESAVTRIQEAREDGESDLRSLIHWCRSQAAARRVGKGA